MRERRGVQLEAEDSRLIAESLVDPAAFGGVFDRHASVLLQYLVRRVGPSDAEGLLGELFRVAFESRTRFDRSRPDARPWLYGIAANLVMKHHRTRSRHDRALERLVVIDSARSTVEFDELVVDDDANAQLLSTVCRAIDVLPEADREVVLLYAWQGLSYAEIAEALQIPVGTVRSRLNRVRSRLRELTDRPGEDPDNPIHRVQGGTGR